MNEGQKAMKSILNAISVMKDKPNPLSNRCLNVKAKPVMYLDLHDVSFKVDKPPKTPTSRRSPMGTEYSKKEKKIVTKKITVITTNKQTDRS